MFVMELVRHATKRWSFYSFDFILMFMMNRIGRHGKADSGGWRKAETGIGVYKGSGDGKPSSIPTRGSGRPLNL